MKERIAADKLVAQSVMCLYVRVTWFNRLSTEDQQYIRAVACAMSKLKMSAPWVIATALIKELDLTVSVSTVVRTLRKIIHDKT